MDSDPHSWEIKKKNVSAYINLFFHEFRAQMSSVKL